MGKTILLTGASTGIGAETARILAKDNELILIYNSSKEKAMNVATDIEKLGGKVHLIQSNLTSESACNELFKKVSGLVNKLDVLINNAGGLIRRQPVRELKWDLMLETFSLNTFSAMKLTSLCIPLLENGIDPNIINITSVVIRHGGPTAVLYAAAKGALDVATRGFSRELAPKIRVNSVCPGVIDTPFHEKVSTPEQMKSWAEANPLKRNGTPSNISSAIKFIIENDFINGESIDINGGLFIR